MTDIVERLGIIRNAFCTGRFGQREIWECDLEKAANEIDRLRSALADMIEITNRNSEAELMLISIRKCAEHALGQSI